MELIYVDDQIVVCLKPARVLSTDEPGGVPDLVREALGIPVADVRTVHRLDRVVAGLMVLARNGKAASELSRQIRDGEFEKEYLAVVHGTPSSDAGTLRDLLGRDKARKMTYVADAPGKGIQEAVLDYHVTGKAQGMTRVRIRLHTGRTHQIRAQFASRNLPLVGERKYSELEDPCEIALWSCRIAFTHPGTGERMEFTHQPPSVWPWAEFEARYKFCQNRDCEYFPCHPGVAPEDFSCLFCYCPLYALGDRCGGSFTYLENGIKDCSRCIRPHLRENYDRIQERMGEVMEMAKKNRNHP